MSLMLRLERKSKETMISTKAENEVTCISELPEEILSLILSFLTVRDGIASRVLSRRWRYLSAQTFDLQFNEFTVLGFTTSPGLREANVWKAVIWDRQRRLRFVTAVDDFLQQYNGRKLQSLTVQYFLDNKFTSYIDRWIGFAIGLGIRRLKIDLSLHSIYHYIFLPEDHDWYLFSCHLLSKASHLEHLSLHICKLTEYMVFGSPCLQLKPNSLTLNALKTINLRRVNLLDGQSALNIILSCCKRLEYLRLQRCVLPKTFSIRGPPPRPELEPSFLSLKLLVLKDCFGVQEIEVSSILLECLEFDGDSKVLTFAGVSTLMERMHYNVRNNFPNGFSKYLPRLQYLYLRLFCRDKGYLIPIPAKLNKFNQLRELKIRFSYGCNFDLRSLARVLNACPYLHKFRLEIYSLYSDIFEGGEKARWSYTEQTYHHLKEVEISGFSGDRCNDELQLAIYLLHNAVRLEQMIIDLWRDPHSLLTSEELEMRRAADELEMKRVHDVLINEDPNVRVIVRDSSHSFFVPSTVKDNLDGSCYPPMFND